MMALAIQALDPPWSTQLQALQERVSNCGGYPAQVDHAKASWSRKPPELFGELKARLAAMCSGIRRCAYCEDSLADEIEHMRPKDLFPEETYVWNNYVLACGPCNGPKNNQFAVLAEDGALTDISRRRGQPVVAPATGIHALIDPRAEDPLELLWLDFKTWRFSPNADDEQSPAFKRAEYTIDVLRLNRRDDLVRGRRVAFSGFEARLRMWVAESAGWDAARRRAFVEDFRGERFQGVWQRMKRHCRDVSALAPIAELMEAAPEATFW